MEVLITGEKIKAKITNFTHRLVEYKYYTNYFLGKYKSIENI